MSYEGSEAVLGLGSTLAYGATSNGTFTSYGEITKITLPARSVKKLNATNMQSLNFTEESKPGMISVADIEADANLTQATWLQANSDLRKIQYFQITLPSDEEGTEPNVAVVGVAKGWVSKVSGDSGAEELIKSKISITLCGDIVWSAAA